MLKPREDAQEGFAENVRSCKVKSFSGGVEPGTNLECGAYLADRLKFVFVLLKLP